MRGQPAPTRPAGLRAHARTHQDETLMNVTVEETDGLKRKLAVEVPLSEVQATYDEVYARLRSNIRVDGFRPGKFPRHLAEKRFQNVMKAEALQNLVPKYYEEALKEVELTPATEPSFDNLDIDKKKPLRFEVTFEVVPAFELPDPAADLSLEDEPVEISDAQVDERIEEQRSRRATTVDKGEAATAEDGDTVAFDFQGTLDGEPFEGGQGEDVRLEIGAGQFLEDFETNLKGAKPGDTRSFDVTFPEDFGNADLAGKVVHFEVTVKAVEEKALPELNAEFFAQFGSDLETEAQFREHIRKQLAEEAEQARRNEQREALADQIRERYDFEVPESQVERMLHEYEHRLEHEDPEALQDEARLEQLKAEQRQKIEGDLRLGYVVDAYAREYGLQPDQEEARQRFFIQAYMMQQNPTELIRTQMGEQLLNHIQQGLLTNAVLDHMADRALGREPQSGTGEAALAEPGSGDDPPPAAEPNVLTEEETEAPNEQE